VEYVYEDKVVLTVNVGVGAELSETVDTPVKAGAADNPKVEVKKVVGLLVIAVFIVDKAPVGLLAAGALALAIGDGIA
jgi:hypothetical protein